MQTLLIISMVFNAFFIVLLYIVNNTWYKYTNKINDEWSETCEKINTVWQEICKKVINELKESI